MWAGSRLGRRRLGERFLISRGTAFWSGAGVRADGVSGRQWGAGRQSSAGPTKRRHGQRARSREQDDNGAEGKGVSTTTAGVQFTLQLKASQSAISLSIAGTTCATPPETAHHAQSPEPAAPGQATTAQAHPSQLVKPRQPSCGERGQPVAPTKAAAWRRRRRRARELGRFSTPWRLELGTYAGKRARIRIASAPSLASGDRRASSSCRMQEPQPRRRQQTARGALAAYSAARSCMVLVPVWASSLSGRPAARTNTRQRC